MVWIFGTFIIFPKNLKFLIKTQTSVGFLQLVCLFCFILFYLVFPNAEFRNKTLFWRELHRKHLLESDVCARNLITLFFRPLYLRYMRNYSFSNSFLTMLILQKPQRIFTSFSRSRYVVEFCLGLFLSFFLLRYKKISPIKPLHLQQKLYALCSFTGCKKRQVHVS